MFCNHCGSKMNQGKSFCQQCGMRFDGNKEIEQAKENLQTINSNQEKLTNTDMKKYAVLSVIIPIIAFIWFCFIGLSFYLAIAIAACGLGFSEKGKIVDPKLANIGKILNIIFLIISIVMFILYLIIQFM